MATGLFLFFAAEFFDRYLKLVDRERIASDPDCIRRSDALYASNGVSHDAVEQVFTTRTLVKIILVLTVVVAMKAASFTTILAGPTPCGGLVSRWRSAVKRIGAICVGLGGDGRQSISTIRDRERESQPGAGCNAALSLRLPQTIKLSQSGPGFPAPHRTPAATTRFCRGRATLGVDGTADISHGMKTTKSMMMKSGARGRRRSAGQCRQAVLRRRR